MGFIYKITNEVNGKLYIGKTSFSVKKRFKRHLYEAKRGKLDYPLYKAMEKYGYDNFTITTIEEIPDEELSEREIYWINFYNTYIKNGKGYNCTLGGEGNKIISEEEVNALWNEGYGVQYISNVLKHDRSAIRSILKNNDNYSTEESNKRGDSFQSYYRFKPVSRYDVDGKYIDTFRNMKEAERQTQISEKSIYLGVHKKQLLVGGFQWRFCDDKPPSDISQEKKYNTNPVIQIDKDTNEIINTYKNAAEARKITDISDAQIRKVCQGKGYTAGGYKWKYGGDLYEHQDNIP